MKGSERASKRQKDRQKIERLRPFVTNLRAFASLTGVNYYKLVDLERGQTRKERERKGERERRLEVGHFILLNLVHEILRNPL